MSVRVISEIMKEIVPRTIYHISQLIFRVNEILISLPHSNLFPRCLSPFKNQFCRSCFLITLNQSKHQKSRL